jgi:hypothetical protein
MVRSLFISQRGRRGRALLLMAMAVGCLGWAAYSLVQSYRPPTIEHVRLGAGTVVERRYQVAEYLAAAASDSGLEVELVSTYGSKDALTKLAAGTIDVALLSSGLRVHEFDHVALLAGLDVAPLHILARNELANAGSSIRDLVAGKRVFVGEPDTNDRDLACEVLKFLRIQCPTNSTAGDFEDVSCNKLALTQLADEVASLTGAARMARAKDLPDVALIVGSLPSTVTQKLLDTRVYTLVPFPYADSFLMTDVGGESDGLIRFLT